MDFLCLPQVDASGFRTDDEEAIFGRGLRIINYLYGHKAHVVVQLKRMPDITSPGMNAVAYDDRGWCKFEEVTSSIVKPRWRLFDLSHATAQLEAGQYQDLIQNCCNDVHFPVHPDQMEIVLRNSKFTNGSDIEKVASIYRKYFDDVAASAKQLEFSPLVQRTETVAVSVEDVKQFALALPCFQQCRSLELSGGYSTHDILNGENTFRDAGGYNFGDEGLAILANAFIQMASLRALTLGRCVFSEVGLEALAPVLRLKQLEAITLPLDLKRTSPAKQAIATWAADGKNLLLLVWQSKVGTIFHDFETSKDDTLHTSLDLIKDEIAPYVARGSAAGE